MDEKLTSKQRSISYSPCL